MKTSILPRLNYRADQHGRYALIIQVIYQRHRSILTTPYRLYPAEFDAVRGRAIPLNRTKRHRHFIREVNHCIDYYVSELRSLADRLTAAQQPYSAQELTSLYKYRSDSHYLHSFASQRITELEQAGRFGTARTYRSLMSAWNKFAPESHYQFAQLDLRTISAFREHLERQGNKRNTVNFYLRTLRALYNRAARCGYVPDSENPFREISFKPAPTPKLAIHRDLLYTLSKYEFENPLLDEARDLFLFSFYARGMSFVDMAFLKKENIWDNALHYQRQKTHQWFHVSLTPQLREIIARYDHSSSPWVLPCMRRGEWMLSQTPPKAMAESPSALQYRVYKMALQFYLILLQRISRRLGCRKLTFNVARHTWATEAQSLGVPLPHISAGLGHTSEKTTRFYLAQLDTRTVDRINERVTKLR